jgi:phenolic acid decarboxylase
MLAFVSAEMLMHHCIAKISVIESQGTLVILEFMTLRVMLPSKEVCFKTNIFFPKILEKKSTNCCTCGHA